MRRLGKIRTAPGNLPQRGTQRAAAANRKKRRMRAVLTMLRELDAMKEATR